MSERSVMTIAARQLGLVVWEQAIEHLTADQVNNRVASGRWVLVRDRVFAVAGSPPTWEQAALAAVLGSGPASVMSHRTAAYLWRLRGFDRPEELEITRWGHCRSRMPGVRGHQSIVSGRIHETHLGPFPVTSVERTLCDLTWGSSPWRIEQALDDAFRRKIASLNALRLVFDELATRGRRRSTVMRAILEARGSEFHPGESNRELDLMRVIERAGLPRPVPQHPIRIGGRVARFDFAYPDLMIAIEYDSWTEHGSRSAFDHDRLRLADVAIAGWLPLLITSAFSEAQIVALITDARAARSREVG